MILPTIHLNGTSAERLFESYHAAWRSVEEARDALGKIEFNARDYYVQQPEAWPTARAEMQARHEKLKAVSDELMTIMQHVNQFIK